MSARRDTPGPTGTWRIALVAPAACVDAFERALEDGACAMARFEASRDGAWQIEALASGPPDRTAIETRLALAAAAFGVAPPDFTVEPVPDTDWLEITRTSFPAVQVGRYHIHGAHLPPSRGAAIDLLIDAGPAFGSGEHETTRGCLLALDGLERTRRVRRALDMGCGSGVLAIAIAKTWGGRVLAVDIDPSATFNTAENARRNGVARRLRTATGDGYRATAVRRGAPYDLIASNILARPLVHMAPDLVRNLAPGGVAILSGLLGRQARSVIAAHRTQGLSLVHRIVLDDWHTLIMGTRRPHL